MPGPAAAPAGDPFEALGDANRRAIVELLSAEPRSVQELADALRHRYRNIPDIAVSLEVG